MCEIIVEYVKVSWLNFIDEENNNRPIKSDEVDVF